MKMLTKTTPKSRLRPPLISTSHHAGSSSAPYRLALIDSQGNIVAVNKEWMTFAVETSTNLDRIGPGTNYLEVCRRASFLSPDARKALNGIQAVLKQKISSF